MVLLLKKLIKIMKKVFSLDFWTEKRVFSLSLFLSLVLMFLEYTRQENGLQVSDTTSYLIIFLPILFFSFLFILFKKKTFSFWLKYTLIFIVFYLISLQLFPSTANFLAPAKSEISLFLSSIFFFSSLILFIFKK